MINTFKLDCKAKEYFSIDSIDDIYFLREKNVFKKNFYILGGGANTLFSKDFDGTVVKVNILGRDIISENNDCVWLKIAAGEDWTKIVEWSVSNNWLGIQNLAMIPGTVGASPVQNIGAYGSEIKDVLESVEFFDFNTGVIKVLSNSDCCFGYRDSIFKNGLKNKGIIISVTLKLAKLYNNAEVPSKYLEYKGIEKELDENFSKPYTLKKVFQAVCNIREEKLPNIDEYGSCGSTFENPVISQSQYKSLLEKFPDLPSYEAGNDMVKIPAAYILERIGWKNRRLFDGRCGTWINHPLIVVNYNHASGGEILSVIHMIQEDFFNSTGIKLESEINII